MFKSSHLLCLLFVMLVIPNQIFAAKIDPTRPFGHIGSSTIAPEVKKMVLESIIHGEGVHTVVISGKVLKVNEYIGEYQLILVNEHSAILRSKTERIELNVFKNNLVKERVAK